MKIRYCSAALAYHPKTHDILVVSNQRRTKFVFPKGGLEPGLSPQENAAKECLEESGYKCSTKGFSLGSYDIFKNGFIHRIEVFALALNTNHTPRPPEKGREVLLWTADQLPRVLDEYLMPFVIKLQDHLDACGVHEAAKEV